MGPNVSGIKRPVFVGTDFKNSPENDSSAISVQLIRLLPHSSLNLFEQLRIGPERRRPGFTDGNGDRTSRVTMQVAAVAGEG